MATKIEAPKEEGREMRMGKGNYPISRKKFDFVSQSGDL